MTVPKIKIKSLHADARMPHRASDRAAAYDVSAIDIDGGVITIPPGGVAILRTGLACGLPRDWCIKVFSRSGHGFKHSVSLSNSVGLVDEDFIGELRVSLRNDGVAPFEIRNGDRIAQIKFERVDPVELVWWTGELTQTARGANGFGSTGVAAVEPA